MEPAPGHSEALSYYSKVAENNISGIWWSRTL